MEYKLRVTNYTLHRKGDSPIFGESCTYISLNDEAGGCFLQIHQPPNDFGEGGTLRLDFDEVPQLIQAIELLRKEAEEIDKEENDDI